MAKKPRKKKEKTIYSFLIPKLRTLSIQWPARYEALKLSKVQVQEGFFKNGNPMMRVKHKCAHCGNLFNQNDVQVDHIIPVSNLSTYGSWDNYINALFCSADKLQILCVECHYTKSGSEATARAEARKSKKNAKKMPKTIDK